MMYGHCLHETELWIMRLNCAEIFFLKLQEWVPKMFMEMIYREDDFMTFGQKDVL
jgi:hypothetical protein